MPTHIPLSASAYGLPRDSIVLLEQVRTIDKRRLREKMGTVDEQSMSAIDNAISISFGLTWEKYFLLFFIVIKNPPLWYRIVYGKFHTYVGV